MSQPNNKQVEKDVIEINENIKQMKEKEQTLENTINSLIKCNRAIYTVRENGILIKCTNNFGRR